MAHRWFPDHGLQKAKGLWEMTDARVEHADAPPAKNGSKFARQLTCGLGILSIGALVVGIQVGWIWYQVRNAANEVIIYKKLLGGGFVAMFAGLLYMVGGNRVVGVFDKMDQGLSQIKWYEWLVLVALGCAGCACYLGVLQYLETLGYKATP
jgi:hypothetical protein